MKRTNRSREMLALVNYRGDSMLMSLFSTGTLLGFLALQASAIEMAPTPAIFQQHHHHHFDYIDTSSEDLDRWPFSAGKLIRQSPNTRIIFPSGWQHGAHNQFRGQHQHQHQQQQQPFPQPRQSNELIFSSRRTTSSTRQTTSAPEVYINNRPTVATVAPFQTPTTASPGFLKCFGSCPTTPEYNPICADNMQLYMNEQKFNCARRCGADIQIVRRGNCQGLFPMTIG